MLETICATKESQNIFNQRRRALKLCGTDRAYYFLLKDDGWTLGVRSSTNTNRWLAQIARVRGITWDGFCDHLIATHLSTAQQQKDQEEDKHLLWTRLFNAMRDGKKYDITTFNSMFVTHLKPNLSSILLMLHLPGESTKSVLCTVSKTHDFEFVDIENNPIPLGADHMGHGT